MTDVLRLEIAPEDMDGFQVLVYVGDVEITSAGAGIGMDPYALLIPDNRLVATWELTTIPIARCECGELGCGRTDVTIVRNSDKIRWGWSHDRPMRREAVFDPEQYDREIARAASDFSWETPVRTAGRLVLTGVDRVALAEKGLRIDWVANDYRDPEVFRVCLRDRRDRQSFVDTLWQGRTPEALAQEVIATVSGADA